MSKSSAIILKLENLKTYFPVKKGILETQLDMLKL